MMKHSRDDDDATSSGVARGDDSRSYDPHRHGEDDDDNAGDEEREIASDVLLSLSLSCWSSPSSSSTRHQLQQYNRIQADQQASGTAAPPLKRRRPHRRGLVDDMFECQTCERRFPTFQALGGHRTSHLRRPAMTKKQPRSSKALQLVHACSACGLGFSTGQALGGHMRKHRMGRDDGMAYFPSADVDLTQIIVQGRPTSASSSLQLLNLFV